MSDLDKRRQRLERARRALSERQRDYRERFARSYDLVCRGGAKEEDFRLVIGEEGVSSGRAMWEPTLTLVETCRDLGLEPGTRMWLTADEYLVPDVLSHRPGDPLGDELRARLAAIDELLLDVNGDPDKRLDAAFIRFEIGHGDGLAQRVRLWSGLAERLATRQMCDPEVWFNRGIHNQWSAVSDYVQFLSGDEPDSAAHWQTSYAGTTAVLKELNG